MSGRHSLLTPERAEALIALVRAGNTLKAASNTVGIGERTLMTWLARGSAGSRGKYRKLFDAIRTARGVAEAATVAQLRKLIGAGHFPAIAFYLERACPDWRQRLALDLTTLEPPAEIAGAFTQSEAAIAVRELVAQAKERHRRALAAAAEPLPTGASQ